jgi:hypothetical protein
MRAKRRIKTRNPSTREGFTVRRSLRYIFTLAGVGFFLARLTPFLVLARHVGLAARLLLLPTLLLPALLFLFPALIIRTIALLTSLLAALLAHTTLLTFLVHKSFSILDCINYGACQTE